VCTAADLPKAQHRAIQDAFDAAFATHTSLRFEVRPGLIGGVELTVGGQKLAWSIDDYLASLEKDIDALLKAEDHPPDEIEAQPKRR